MTSTHAGSGDTVRARPARARARSAVAVVSALLLTLLMLTLAGCTAAPPDDREASMTPSPTQAEKTAAEVFPGGPFLDPRSEAMSAEAAARAAGDTGRADKIAQISRQPTAIWLGEWYSEEELPRVLGEYRAEAAAEGRTLVFVIYAIPNRDCGGLSAGGLGEEDYLGWVRAVADALEGSGAALIIEPDSLAMLESEKCGDERERRLPLINQALDIFTAAGLTSYLDAGNNNWVPEKRMAQLLTEAGVERARGFFTNVSNFYRVDEERAYADALSEMLGGAHFVIDVSRNGNGWRGDWCNPQGAALGQSPRVTTGGSNLDALLWVKHPGVSDGACNGGPVAGEWWDEYAIGLVDNRPADQGD
jgi:endoglucanase